MARNVPRVNNKPINHDAQSDAVFGTGVEFGGFGTVKRTEGDVVTIFGVINTFWSFIDSRAMLWALLCHNFNSDWGIGPFEGKVDLECCSGGDCGGDLNFVIWNANTANNRLRHTRGALKR